MSSVSKVSESKGESKDESKDKGETNESTSRYSISSPTHSLSRVADDLRAVNERLVISSIREHEVSESAQREKAQLNALLVTLGEGVVIAEGTGRVLMMNQAARRILRIGDSVDVSNVAARLDAIDFRHVDNTSLRAGERPLRRAMRGETFVDLEMLLCFGGDDVHRLKLSGASTFDGGDLALAILVFRDVTGNALMEQRAAQTERLAALGTLSAGLAHEINNPLAYVVSNVDYALQVIPEAQDCIRALSGAQAPTASTVLTEVMVALGEAQEGCMRVCRIVRDVKDFARLDVGELSVLDLPTVLDTAIRMTESLVRQHATVRREYAWTPHIEADAAQLGQVFMNLLVNAAQAIAAGSTKTKEIVVSAFTDARGRAVVEVRDSGPGISPEIKRRIFDPFFTTKGVGNGTGLGLSICHSIVGSFDGDLSMESELGKGATFRVTLAPVTDHPLPIEERPSATIPVAKRRMAERRKRILMIDDEAAILRALTRFLRRDYDLISASSADEALHRISTDDAFDVVLCDLMMAGTNGIQLHETLCQTNPKLALKLVFLTGGASSPETQEFLRKSQNPTLTKPVDGEELLRFLADFTALPSKQQ